MPEDLCPTLHRPALTSAPATSKVWGCFQFLSGRSSMGKHVVSRRAGVFTFIASVVVLAGVAGNAPADSWKFLVCGDSRGTSTANQINTNVLKEIAYAITNEQPAFVLFAGDLVNSGNDTAFRAWTNIMAPVYQAGIGLYPVMGNHDTAAVSAYTNIFGPGLPANGPSGELYRTFSFCYSNALFLGLDNYVNLDRVNQAWVDSVLATNYMPHVFAYGHVPAFVVDTHDTLGNYVSQRDVFWRSLEAVGAKAYFCGHAHFYDHARLDSGDGNSSNDVHQFVVGTAGAPLGAATPTYTGNNSSWTPQGILHEAQYGYLVVEISRLDVTMTWKHRIGPSNYVAAADILSYSIVPRPARMDIDVSDAGFAVVSSNLVATASNRIEVSDDLLSGVWTSAVEFVSFSNRCSQLLPMDRTNAFYRIRTK
ncbi:MAG: hypothetical protein C0404_08995 [Verrucomicrobia bacterium]|nr:hypothetical protein [Verrucomicrobiota bacterium]